MLGGGGLTVRERVGAWGPADREGRRARMVCDIQL